MINEIKTHFSYIYDLFVYKTNQLKMNFTNTKIKFLTFFLQIA